MCALNVHSAAQSPKNLGDLGDLRRLNDYDDWFFNYTVQVELVFYEMTHPIDTSP